MREQLATDGVTLRDRDFETLVRDLVDEVTGLGPLEPLLKDDTISDILVNTHRQVFVERGGVLVETEVRFKDDAHLMRVIEKITRAIGRRVDESQPWVDARLADGSRVNAMIPPCAVDGPLLSIRKFTRQPLSVDRLVENGTMTNDMVEYLRASVVSRLNVLIAGGTGSGKTTTLNALSNFITDGERVVTIEDTAELQLQQNHVGRMESRPSNAEGQGEVTLRDLLRNALRMRPDRIIVGEVRGAEVLDMLQAMNTGHEGSMTTIHANTPRDAFSRMENMVLMTGLEVPLSALRAQIASAINVVLQIPALHRRLAPRGFGAGGGRHGGLSDQPSGAVPLPTHGRRRRRPRARRAGGDGAALPLRRALRRLGRDRAPALARGRAPSAERDLIWPVAARSRGR